MKKLVAVVFAFGVLGCSKPTFKEAAYTTVRTADLAYGLAVEACDAKEKTIIARPCPGDQTSQQCKKADERDIIEVREACDKVFQAFESARNVAPAVKRLEEIGL